MTVTSRSAPTNRAVVLFHRPVEDRYHGASVTCQGLVQALSQSFVVSVVAPPLTRRKGGTRPAETSLGLTTALGLLSMVPRVLRAFVSDTSVDTGRSNSVLVAFGAWVAGPAALWAKVRDRVLIYYPQDYLPLVAQRWTETGRFEGLVLRWLLIPIERRVLRLSDLVLVHTEKMGASFRGEGVQASALVVYTVPRPIPVENPSARNLWAERLGSFGRIVVVFVGTFDYAPNIDAFELIRTTIAPRALDHAPSALFVVVGRGSERFAGEVGPNVRVLGAVDDLDGLLFACDVGIAPMHTPGGRSNKIIDYALHGLRVVATPEAASGMPDSPRVKVSSITDFPDAVLSVVSELVTTPDRSHSKNPDPAYVTLMGASRSFPIGRRIRAAADSRPQQPERLSFPPQR